MNRIVYDLDDTLIDTHEAVRRAYLHVGIKMPPDAWGKSWQEWLPSLVKKGEAEHVHHLKNVIYPEMLERYARPLPLLRYALRDSSVILTGASIHAVWVIKRWLKQHDYGAFATVWTGLTREQKAVYLKTHTYPRAGFYVDDDTITRTLIQEKTTWRVLTPEEAFTALSSQPAPTPD